MYPSILASQSSTSSKTNTARRVTNRHTRARIATKIRTAREIRKRIAKISRKSTKAAPTERIVTSLTNTKVPAHRKISIPVVVAQNTKAKTKTETAIEIVTGVIITKAAARVESTRARTKIASVLTSTKAANRRVSAKKPRQSTLLKRCK